MFLLQLFLGNLIMIMCVISSRSGKRKISKYNTVNPLALVICKIFNTVSGYRHIYVFTDALCLHQNGGLILLGQWRRDPPPLKGVLFLIIFLNRVGYGICLPNNLLLHIFTKHRQILMQ